MPWDVRAGRLLIAALLLLTPFVFAEAKNPFRLPKLLLAEILACASLVLLALALRRVAVVRLRDATRPVVLAVLPLLLVAAGGLLTSDSPLHVRSGLVSLSIGAAAMVGWSLAIDSLRLSGLLRLLLWPASLLAVLALDQRFQVVGLAEGLELQTTERVSLTATAGSPGDLSAYLVLPVLVAQATLRNARGRAARMAAAACLLLSIVTLALCQTFASLAAVAAGSVVFWLLAERRRALSVILAVLGLTLVVLFGVPGFRARTTEKLSQLAAGDLNAVLTGRLDGWRAAVFMLGEHPLSGVGHGAFVVAFSDAKLALLEQGVEFFREQHHVMFANAHNELLEVGACMGVPGLLALGWACLVLGRAARRLRPHPRASPLAWSGATALVILASLWFPLRVAMVAYPWLLFLAWVFGAAEEQGR